MPLTPIRRAIAQRVIFQEGLEHELRKLLPLMETAGFSDLAYDLVKFSMMGLFILAFVRGSAERIARADDPSVNRYF